MPLEHCIDQHWVGNLIYFFRQDSIKHFLGKDKNKTSAPFASLLGAVFDCVTGVNPRRSVKSSASGADTYDANFEKRPFVKATRRAQILSLVSLQRTNFEERESTKADPYIVSGELDDSWLAGMLGPTCIKLSGKEEAMLTLRPSDISQHIAIRMPTIRKSNKENLTDEQEQEAIDKFFDLLKTSQVSLNSCSAPLPCLENAKLSIQETADKEYEYMLHLSDGRVVSWDDVKKYNIEVPTHVPLLTRDFFECMKYNGKGVDLDLKEAVKTLMLDFDFCTLRKSATILNTNLHQIHFENISRSGGGTKRAVVAEDIPAFQFLLLLSTICPAALKPTPFRIGSFTIQSLPILWHVRDIIHDQLLTMEDQDQKIENGWDKTVGIDSGREPHVHQREAVEQLITRGKDLVKVKGNFLWMNVGAGKTMVVLLYLCHLIENNQLPPYVIYSLPPSALEAIKNELNLFGFAYEEVTRSKKRKANLQKHRILLVKHDSMREMEDELIEIASKSFFIIDESHLALNNTKRTGVALDLARLSKEFIALTGTPVIDNKVVKLVPWLEQIVPFEVNVKNIWVAASDMISHLYNTGIRIESIEVEATMNEKEATEYRKLVPAGMGGVNPYATYEHLNRASEISYSAMNRAVVNQVIQLLEEDKATFVVARSGKHRDTLHEMILEYVDSEDVLVLDSKNGNKTSVYLTDDAVEKGLIHDYKVVITTLTHCTGYSVTRLKAMVTGVYPSNQATREQMEGRINRMGQKSKEIPIYTVHCGLLSFIMKNHKRSASLSAALKMLANEVPVSNSK